MRPAMSSLEFLAGKLGKSPSYFLDDEEQERKRTEREARALAGLRHPAVVTLFDARLDATPPYLVLELVDGETLARLEGEGLVVFRYVTPAGEVTEEANVNGSMNNIAGIINQTGNVMGLMPHPERVVEGLLGGTDGLGLFTSLAKSFAGAASATS